MKLNTNNFKKCFATFLKDNFNITAIVTKVAGKPLFIVNDLQSKQDILYILFPNNFHHFDLSPTFEIYAANRSDIYLINKIYNSLNSTTDFRLAVIKDFNKCFTDYPFLKGSDIAKFNITNFDTSFSSINSIKLNIQNQKMEIFGYSEVNIARFLLVDNSILTIKNSVKVGFSDNYSFKIVDNVTLTIKSQKTIDSMSAFMSSNYSNHRWINFKLEYVAYLFYFMDTYFPEDVLKIYENKSLNELKPEEIQKVVELTAMLYI